MNTIVFHGTAMPDPDWARTVAGDLVLQPYHPILQVGTYADWFPRARRFVYVNPTATDPLRRPDITADMVFRDPQDRWGLPRLQLPAALDWAVADAVEIAQRPGVDGIFVDDLDRLLGTRDGRQVAVSYVHRVAVATGAAVYVNRAFAILDALPSLEAVLVEDAADELGSPAAAVWLDDVVLPALSRARRLGARIHRLDYGDCPAAPDTTTRSSANAMDSLATSIARLPHPCLDQWSWWRDETSLYQPSNRDGEPEPKRPETEL